MNHRPQASDISSWFSPNQQTVYINTIVGQSGLTRRQATCFVRLWAYACLQENEWKDTPLSKLNSHVKAFSCSHREAADLFYSDRPRGSARSAGMMVDQLVCKQLVRREPFDGGPTRLCLKIPDSFLPKINSFEGASLRVDTFNARSDAPLAASFLEEAYSWDSGRPEAMSYKIKRVLRQWAILCPDGLRVLRREDDEPVGFAALFPVHADSEERLHLPPSLSLHLSTLDEEDPFKAASPGDQTCYSIFIRSWQVKREYWNYSTACQFLQDSQTVLKDMQASFPNLCDLFTISINPHTEALALTLGFKATKADQASSIHWFYMPLDRFLSLDCDEAMVEFDFKKYNSIS